MSRRSTNNNQGVEVTCKGYTNFKNRQDIDLKFIAYEQIGNGTFGKIHRIKYDGTDMALKIVHQDPDYCNRELDILERLRDHPNIIHICFSYYTRFEGKIYLNLITELLCHTLYNTIYSSNPRTNRTNCSRRSSSRNNVPQMCMEVTELQKCFKGIFNGLKFMHSKDIAHRDLKPENLGFSFSGEVKIIDMGSAKLILPKVKNSYEVCTLLYRAPELLLCNQDYKCDIDIWAIGCVLAETINSMPIFFEQNTTTILRQIVSVIGRPPSKLLTNIRGPNLSYLQNAPVQNVEDYMKKHIIKQQNIPDTEVINDLVELLMGVLSYTNRMTAAEALNCAFFNKVYTRSSPYDNVNNTISGSAATLMSIDQAGPSSAILVDANPGHDLKQDNNQSNDSNDSKKRSPASSNIDHCMENIKRPRN